MPIMPRCAKMVGMLIVETRSDHVGDELVADADAGSSPCSEIMVEVLGYSALAIKGLDVIGV